MQQNSVVVFPHLRLKFVAIFPESKQVLSYLRYEMVFLLLGYEKEQVIEKRSGIAYKTISAIIIAERSK